MDKIIVTMGGVFGIFFTYWFFLGKRDSKAKEVIDSIDVVVKGGYSPDVISVKKGKTVTINFIRKDESSCLEEVILSDFKIKKYLPLNKKVSVQITPQKTGKFDFSCGMGMFHGKLIVEDPEQSRRID